MHPGCWMQAVQLMTAIDPEKMMLRRLRLPVRVILQREGDVIREIDVIIIPAHEETRSGGSDEGIALLAQRVVARCMIEDGYPGMVEDEILSHAIIQHRHVGVIVRLLEEAGNQLLDTPGTAIGRAENGDMGHGVLTAMPQVPGVMPPAHPPVTS